MSTENNAVHPPNRVSRRQFLKGVLAVPLAATVTGEVSPLDEDDNELVTRAIERHLGLKPEDVLLKDRFSYHLLTPAALSEVERFQATAVTGEIDPEHIKPDTLKAFAELQQIVDEKRLKKIPEPTPAFLMRLLIPGFGAKPEELLYHFEQISQWLVKGKPTVIPADISIAPIIDEPRDLRDYAAMLVPTFALLGGLATLSNSNKRLSRREFLKVVGKSLAVVFGSWLTAGLVKSFVSFDPPEEVAPVASRVTDWYASLTDFLSKPDPDNPWMSLIKAVVPFRNSTMALNTWCAVAKRSSPSHQERIFFYAGSGHQGVKKTFIDGPQKCEQGHKQYALTLLTIGLELLLQKATTLPLPEDEQLTPEQISIRQDDWLVNQLSFYAYMFPEPTFFSPKESSTESSSATYFPKTPRSVFLDALQEAIDNYAANPNQLRQKTILERLFQYRRSLIVQAASDQKKRQTYPYAEGKNLIGFPSREQYVSAIRKSYLTQDDLLVNSQTENDQIMAASNEDPKKIWSKVQDRYSYNLPFQLVDDRWLIGLTSFRGSYVPVFRSVGQSPNNSEEVIAHDYAMVDGTPVQFRQYRYQRVNYTNKTFWDQTLHDLRQRKYSALVETNGTPKEVWRNSRFYQVMETFPSTNYFWLLDVPNSDPDPLDVMIITDSTAGPFVKGSSIFKKE